MNASGGRDVLVVLREELATARATLDQALLVWKGEQTAGQVQLAAQKLSVAAEALDARIHAPFDGLLLERAAAAFRAAAAQLTTQLADRHATRRGAPDIARVMQRFVAHAREIGKLAHQRGADHVGAAILALGTEEGWTGAPLDAVVQLVDTLEFFSRSKLGDQARASQVSSLVDRAASTAMVSCMHALKELAQRVRSEPTLLKDRFALTGALRPAVASVVERLGAWFALDAAGRSRLQGGVEQFAQRLLDRLTAAR